MISARAIERLAALAPLAAGYRFEPLKRNEVRQLIAALMEWFPDIRVGGASCYLREEFYARKAWFADTPTQGNIVLLLKQGAEVVGMFSCELDPATESIYAGLGVVSPNHRGAKLAQAGMAFTESLGRHFGAGFIFGMATLKHPYAQQAFERAGWELVGITPGYDRELVAPGVVKRVYEALYAKVLAADGGLQQPERGNLTPRTRAFFDSIFAKCGLEEHASDLRMSTSSRCSQ